MPLIVTVIVAAQVGTDFSGHWVLLEGTDRAPSVAVSMDVEQPIVRTTAQGSPMPPAFLRLTVHRHFAQSSRVETYLVGVVGGTVAGSDHGPVSSTSVSTHWDEGRLVIETSATSGGVQYSAVREIWELDSTGRLRTSRTEQLPGGSTITAAVYQRER